MYAAGAAHSHKLPSVRLLERIANGDLEATIDAATLQEVLHRYRAIKRWSEGRAVYDLAREIFPDVIPVTAAVLDRARTLLDGDATLMARDALHAAVVMEEGLRGIYTYDRDFDRIKGIRRLEPSA